MTLNEAGSDQARCRIICLGCALLVGLTLCACGSAQPYRATVSSHDLQRQDQEARYQRMLLVAQQDEQARYLALAEDARSGKPQPWQGAMSYQNNSVYVPTRPTPANMSHAEAYRQRRDIAEKKARDLALHSNASAPRQTSSRAARRSASARAWASSCRRCSSKVFSGSCMVGSPVAVHFMETQGPWKRHLHAIGFA